MPPTAPLNIQTPRVFAPLLHPTRYKGVWGGRGSGKSHFFAELLVEHAMLRPGLRVVCIREIQKSLAMSVKQLVTDKIIRLHVAHQFEILDKEIRTPGGGVIIFQGMQNHTADSIKSLEGFDIAWVEEAQSLSAHSLKLLRPTIRKPGSELWFSWNPASESDPVDCFLRHPNNKADENMAVICANWADNPWFPAVLNDERTRDLTLRPEEYDHIWEGAYQHLSEAVIFGHRVSFKAFNTPQDARFYYGVDWGFAKDPTAVVRCFITDDILHIDHEAGGVGIELDRLPAVLDTVPGVRDWPIHADGARPETISYLANRHHYPISAADKWPGSVEDGIEHLKSFQGIRVHPRCAQTAREFRLYRYKVDHLTGDVLPKIEDANNHYIDACIAEGERVWTDRGHIPIECVTTNDRVMTRQGYKRVLDAGVTGLDQRIWAIKAGGNVLRATPDHRIFTLNRGFVRVDALTINDVLLLKGKACHIETLDDGYQTASRVYNLTVEECPEFFAEGILVHNCRYSLNGIIQNHRKMPDFSAFAGQNIARRSFI